MGERTQENVLYQAIDLCHPGIFAINVPEALSPQEMTGQGHHHAHLLIVVSGHVRERRRGFSIIGNLTVPAYVPGLMMIGIGRVTMATNGGGEATALIAIEACRHGEFTTLIGHHLHRHYHHGSSVMNARHRGVFIMIGRLLRSMSRNDMLNRTLGNGAQMTTGQTSTPGTMSQRTKGEKRIVPLRKSSSKGGRNLNGSGAVQVRASETKRLLLHPDTAR
jgi:hypothetical protein